VSIDLLNQLRVYSWPNREVQQDQLGVYIGEISWL
jgi:hypothetical protein